MKSSGEKMDSSPAELKIPILSDLDTSPKTRNRIRCRWESIGYAAGFAFFVGCVIRYLLVDEKNGKLYYRQPEFELNSLVICPSFKESSVIWDLKFDMKNPYNDSDICILGGFYVSVYPYNQSNLLSTAFVFPTICAGPSNHTPVIAFADASDDYLDPTTGETIRLDLKIDSDIHHLVCGDAKVVGSSNSSSLSCASMVGSPFACSYTSTSVADDHSWTHFLALLVVAVLFSLFLIMLPITMAVAFISVAVSSRVFSY